MGKHKAALGRVDGQGVIGHQGRNAQVELVAALRCGIFFRRLRVERRVFPVNRREIAHERADGPPVDRSAVFLAGDVVVGLGVVHKPDGLGAGDGVLGQLGIAVLLHRAVRVQGLAGVCGGINARVTGLIHRHLIARHDVADFDVADGRLGGAVVGFDVGRVGRVVQVFALQIQWPGGDFDGCAHIALGIHAGQIILFQHRRAEGRGGGVGALVDALLNRLAVLGVDQDAAGHDLRFLRLAACCHGQHGLAGLAVVHLFRVGRQGHGSVDFCVVCINFAVADRGSVGPFKIIRECIGRINCGLHRLRDTHKVAVFFMFAGQRIVHRLIASQFQRSRARHSGNIIDF